MNRRGYAPMIFLLVFTLVLIVTALGVMASFSGDIVDRSKETNNLVRSLDVYENYVVSDVGMILGDALARDGDLKANVNAVVNEKDYIAEEFGNIYGKLRSGSFTTSEGIAPLGASTLTIRTMIIEVEDVFVLGKVGENEVRREFDLKMEFDQQGNLRKVYK